MKKIAVKTKRNTAAENTASKTSALLGELSGAFGVTGFEEDMHRLVKKHLAGVCGFEFDRSGSIICRHSKAGARAAGSAGRRKVGIFTHIDEIGFMVRGITPAGFLKFIGLGGWTTQTLPSQRVVIRNTDGGLVHGVIGMKPPHMMSEDERGKAPRIDSLYIDIGARSAQDVAERFKIELGCPAAPYSEFSGLNGSGLVCGKAFDNRAGVTAMIEIMRCTAGLNASVEVIGVGSSQEESGLRGAKTSAFSISPDVAIVIDTPPADDTPNNETAYPAQGKIGCGPQVRLFDPTMIANPWLVAFVKKTAAAAGIPVQYAVRSSGGTDAGSVHLVNGGVPTIVIGIPTRYIHSHTSVMDVSDILGAVKLVKAMISRLTPQIADSF